MSMLDLIVTCPYDKTHRIHKSALFYHLTRCHKNHTSKNVQCSFDAHGIIGKLQLKNHELNYANSGNVKEKGNSGLTSQLGSVSLETVKNLSVPIMKDWKEENVPTYDPWKSTEKRNIARCLIGGTKSQRKKFKVAERQRIQNLEKKDIWHSSTRNNFKHKTRKRKLTVISQLIKNLRQLNIENTDTPLKSTDISKLVISENNKKDTFIKKKYISEIIEKVLAQKVKKLSVHQIKKEDKSTT